MTVGEYGSGPRFSWKTRRRVFFTGGVYRRMSSAAGTRHDMFAKARISVRESSRFMAKERILNLDNNGFSPDLRRKAMRCWTGSVTLIFRSGLMGGLLQVVELSYPTVVEITTKCSRLRWIRVPFLLPPLSLSSLQLCFFLNQNSTNSSPTRFPTTSPLFASSPPSFLCGTHRIGSKFRLGRKIGSGSFREIYIVNFAAHSVLLTFLS
ncbi:hypothetical protein F2Q68_00033538 [Brassica cretica]|uniref:Uncharacterized protein n=1 Tax=Brassica cretica TaxID=69181 RepID=A0A8S9H6K0_BRACR|nr:hypothetical protein F2Q68_00033538 [Brassica cretica]